MRQSEKRPTLEDRVDPRSWLRFAGIVLLALALAAGAAALLGRDPRDRLLVFAAGVLGLVGAIHSVLGEVYVLRRLIRRGPLPRLLGSSAFTRRTLQAAWHLTTVAWWGLGAVVLTARSGAEPGTVLATTACVAAVSALIAAAVTRLQHPVWAAFAAVAVALWLAASA